MKTRINMGKIDFCKSGRRINPVEIEMELKDGVFTASVDIWNHIHTDCIACGQCFDYIKPFFKSDSTFKKIYNWWEKYHLNDMHSGTVRQEEALEKAGINSWANEYKECCDYLESIGLLIDDGYKFGTSWLKRDIPEQDLIEIQKFIEEN